MAIDAATVRKVASLARSAEPEDRLEPLAKELSWIEQLNQVDSDGVEPMTSPLPMREDVVTDGGDFTPGGRAALPPVRPCRSSPAPRRPAQAICSSRQGRAHGRARTKQNRAPGLR